MIALHVTPVENLPSILSVGIRPAIGDRSVAAGETKPRVYLFPSREDCETALSTWLGDEFEDCPDDGLAILEVDITGLQLESDVAYEVSVAEDIEASRIVSVMNESWKVIAI